MPSDIAGFSLKTTTLAYSSLNSGHQDKQQKGGEHGRYSSSFHSRKLTSQFPYQNRTANHHFDGKTLENAFWQQRPLAGRNATPIDVMTAYKKDHTSLRPGLFLSKLYLKGIPFNGGKITPNQVVDEFNRARDRNDKCQLSIAIFMEQCCLNNLLFKQKGQQKPERVTPDAVVKAYPDSPEGKVAIARFNEQCCLRRLPLHGQLVTPDAVIKTFRAVKAPLELARFMEHCCLNRLLLTPDGRLNPEPVTPDAVAQAFRAAKAPLEIARFKEQCCLRGLLFLHDGKQEPEQVTPDEVMKAYREYPQDKLSPARFIEQCCLRGLYLSGQQVTPDAVIMAFPDSPSGKLGLARFQGRCCLRGFLLGGQQVTPDAVVNTFPNSPLGKLGLARFMEACCLRGLLLRGRQVAPDEIVTTFLQSLEQKLSLARFKEACCLKGLLLNGQLVTPDAVVASFSDIPEGKKDIAYFQAECCLRGLSLGGQQVTPDKVVEDYEKGGWQSAKAMFYAQLALNGKKLQGSYLANHQVLEAFNKLPGDQSYSQADYLLKRLHTLAGYDETDEALETFQQAWQILNNAPVKDDENYQQVCVLHFIALQYDLPVDQRYSADQILQTINSLRRSFRKTRFLFFFLAYCFNSNQSIGGQKVRIDQVLACLQRLPAGSKIRRALECWFERLGTRCDAVIVDKLLFFKRAKPLMMGGDDDHPEKYHPSARQSERAENLTAPPPSGNNPMGLPAKRVEVYVGTDAQGCFYPQRIIEYRHDGKVRSGSAPGDTFLRNGPAITSPHSDILGSVQAEPVEIPCRPPSSGHPERSPATFSVNENKAIIKGQSPVSAVAAQNLKQMLNINEPTASQSRVLHPLILGTLEMIQEINGTYDKAVILITGSFSRYLQGGCPSFNDIDLICITEGAAEVLMARLQTQNSEGDTDVAQIVTIRAIPGCPQIKLPKMYNIKLIEGDLGIKAVELQATIDNRGTPGNTDLAPIHLPGVERPVLCLPIHAEAQLVIEALSFLADHLDLLTEQLQKKPGFFIPRTLLFNYPKSSEERIFGLLMRCLLTLNKARQFQTLLIEGKTGYQPGPYDTTLVSLQKLTAKLQAKLQGHSYRDPLVRRLEGAITSPRPNNDYMKKKCQCIQDLLEILTVA